MCVFCNLKAQEAQVSEVTVSWYSKKMENGPKIDEQADLVPK